MKPVSRVKLIVIIIKIKVSDKQVNEVSQALENQEQTQL